MAKVLLIEDEPLTVKIYSTYLKGEGHQVATADNGEDGLRWAFEFRPNLIVLDLMMPKIDGFSFLATIKSDERTKKIPVIIYSNLSSDEDIQKAKKLGAHDFLVKTKFTPTQVINKLKHYLPSRPAPSNGRPAPSGVGPAKPGSSQTPSKNTQKAPG